MEITYKLLSFLRSGCKKRQLSVFFRYQTQVKFRFKFRFKFRGLTEIVPEMQTFLKNQKYCFHFL